MQDYHDEISTAPMLGSVIEIECATCFLARLHATTRHEHDPVTVCIVILSLLELDVFPTLQDLFNCNKFTVIERLYANIWKS